MAADYVNTLFAVRKAISLGTPIVEAWDAVVHHIAGEVGTEVSSQLRALDVAEDLARLEDWLLDVLKNVAPPRAIRGLRFGLFHPDLGDRPSCDIYLTGSRSFDEESDAWAYDTSYQARSNPHSRILDALYQISAEDRFEGQAAVVHVCLWFALLAVAELCRRHSVAIRGSAPRRGIGAGFDGGDLINLGVHSKSRFAPVSVEEKKRRPKRRKLLPGEYFKLEGGRDLLMCECTEPSLPRGLFRGFGPIAPQSLTATISPDWPNQRGTLGSLQPFSVEFFTASVSKEIEAAFPNEVQFHELKIQGSSEDWRVMKVLQCVKCFNREVSDREQRLTLWRDAIAGHNIFFVAGYYEGSAVLVSRPAAQLLIDQGVIGAEFIPVATNGSM